jgi:hypothetical protein
MRNRVDAKQGLIDVERAADRLHRAARAEQEERVGPASISSADSFAPVTFIALAALAVSQRT